ncbi:putative flavin-containing monooxygenase 1 [Citrus sinensis]|uniref:Flavin-containing monooxygenase 1 n=1 Tax=Citrus sinensis TaxID=2711 RepID=A0ACB8P5V4_CITSI|nr:putative flavin-containing monooxygenase 1 [Citrus sinensis]
MASAQNHVQYSSKIGIIGAGISGIAAAKQLRHYDPLVFEATNSIGGVWKHCSFNSTKLQTPRCDFEFSDYPWPERDDASFPSHVELLDYLHGYAVHFDVLKYIKFNSKVVEIRHLGDRDTARVSDTAGEYGSLLKGHPVWEVAVETNQAIQWYGFELLVMCIGKFGDIPRMPAFPANKGEEIFGGKVLHSMDYSKLDKEAATELLEGKKVAIIGYRKSAIDLAVECAEANQAMYNGDKDFTLDSSIIQDMGIALFLILFNKVFSISPSEAKLRLPQDLPLFHIITHDHPFEEDYASCQMAILPENFFSEAEKGNILFKRASKWWFWSGGIEFEDKSKLEADVVLLATGYDGKKKLQSILPKPFSSLLADSSGIMPLYRGTIHPLIPNMAFVGYIETVSNLQIAEIRCKWLARLADQKFKLPAVEKMLEQTTKEVEIMKQTTRFFKRHCISTFSINHRDEICEEMGWKSWRKNNWISEAFMPYSSQDYQEAKY